MGLGERLLPRDASVLLPSWAKRIGVTRVARVTGLDRCGVEVACAIRPAGLVLQVSNGKGATFRDAKASALSEALELWACENVDPRRVRWLAEEADGRFWSSAHLHTGRVEPHAGTTVQPWAEAERLDAPGTVFVPAAHVWCPAAGANSVGLRTLQWTANGLGAHPDPLRARWHGLLELLEREALARVFPDGWLPEHLERRSLRLDHALVPALLSQGMRVHCLDATPAGWPIPVVAVLIVDSNTRAPRLAAGYACRPAATDAAEAALFEACQSRLTEIHGAREDVSQTAAEIPDWLGEPRRPRKRVAALPKWRGTMRALLRRLGAQAAAVDLTPAGVPVSVARVFVPGARISDLLF